MVGEAAVFLHLIELRGIDQHQRVLLPVDDAGLQRAVRLVEVDRGRRGAEMAEQRDQIRRDRQADLEAAQVVGAGDRLGPRGDLAEAVVVALVQAIEADLLRHAAQHVAELAVHRRPDMVIVGERKADAGNAADRIARREQIDRQDVHLQRAGDRLRDHRRVAAENAVGVDGDLHPPVGLLLDLVGGLLRARHRRVLHRRGGAELVAELRGIGRPVQDGGGADARCSRDHMPARQPVALHRRFLLMAFVKACRHGHGQVKLAAHVSFATRRPH